MNGNLRYAVLALCIVLIGTSVAPPFSRAGGESSRVVLKLLKEKALKLNFCGTAYYAWLDCGELLGSLNDLDVRQIVRPSNTIPESKLDGPINAQDICHGAVTEESFAMEQESSRGVPTGPYDVYDLNDLLPLWENHRVVTAEGYLIPNDSAGNPQDNPLRPKWKSYWLVSLSGDCHPLPLATLYMGDSYPSTFSPNSPDVIVSIEKRTFILSLREIGEGSGSFSGELYSLPDDPKAYSQCCSLVMSFVAR